MILSGMIGKFYSLSEWLFKLLIANGIWVFFNFPVAYLCLSLFFVPTVEDGYVTLTVIFLLLPFISYPATTALFGLMRQWIVKKKSDKWLSFYWTVYKQNYVKSVMGGLFFVLLWGLWIVNYSLAAVEMKSLLFLFLSHFDNDFTDMEYAFLC